MAFTLLSSVASHNSLLVSLEPLLVSQGWTVERSGFHLSTFRELLVSFSHDPGSGSRTYRYSLWTDSTGNEAPIRLAGRTGYAAADSVYLQPGHAAGPILSTREEEMIRAWVFVLPKFCHIVVEVQTGYFASCHFGCLDLSYEPPVTAPYGSIIAGGHDQSWSRWPSLTATGGGHFGLTQGNVDAYQSSVRLYLDTVGGPQWSTLTGSPRWRTNAQRQTTLSSYVDSPLCSLVRFPRVDGSRPLMPLNVYGEHEPGQTPNFFLYGTLPDFRVHSHHGLTPATLFQIAGDDWLAFPTIGHNRNITPIYNNQEFGFSIKK